MVSPFPVSSLRMEKERGHMTERMLNLTLEIIYLLTGENYIAFKLRDGFVAPNLKKAQSPFALQPPSLTTESNNDKKIEEVIQKIIELLAGEVPTRHQDANEEHKDAKMENRPPLTSSDGSRNRNTPERCPRPLYSRDSTQEHQIPEEHHEIPQEDQGNSVVIKVEDEDNPYVRGDELCKEEDIPPEINTDGLYRWYTTEECPESSLDSKEDDDDFPADSPEDPMTTDLQPSSHSVDLVDPSTLGGNFSNPSLPVTYHTTYGASKKFPCSKCGKCFTQVTTFLAHKRTHMGEAPHSCPDCGLRFDLKKDLANHLASHTTDQPYTCFYCRKHFSSKSRLDRHELIHTGHKPYSCSMCGKRFTQKANLARHERTHTGEKPFACPECGKCFTRKATLIEHQYLHK